MPESKQQNLTFVLIDDDPTQLRLLRRSIEGGFAASRSRVSIREFEDPSDALVDLPADGRSVIICDYMLGKTTGVTWIRDFVASDVGPVIIVSASGNEQVAAEAFRKGAADYLMKSRIFADPQAFCDSIEEALRQFDVRQRTRTLTKKLKLANNELERKNDTLARITETAHRFVDDVAHEFRTPLTVIREFASIMRDGIGGEVCPDHRDYISFIMEATEELTQLVEDFLDSGRLRNQTLRVERQPHTINDVFDSIAEIVKTRSSAKNITIEYQNSVCDTCVYADLEKLQRSLINLVVNAIKFSDTEDTIVIRAASGGNGMVNLSVIDSGPGLHPEELECLFQRFHQASSAHQVTSKGFGLGLDIVRELTAINLGTVSVESTYGEGSTFAVSLPSYDFDTIIQCYSERVLERSATAAVSILRATSDHQRVTPADMINVIAQISHPTDLQLIGMDSTSVIIAGESIETNRWIERVLEFAEKRIAQNASAAGASITFEHLCTVDGVEAIQRLRDLVTVRKGKLRYA